MKYIEKRKRMKLFNTRIEWSKSLGIIYGDPLNISIRKDGVYCEYRCMGTYMRCTQQIHKW